MHRFLIIFTLFYIQLFGLNLDHNKAVVSGISGDFCEVYVGDLQIGQSAIITHHYTNDKIAIVAVAEVVNSSPTKSTLKINHEDILAQDAFPKIGRKVQNGDIAIINHLYSNVLIIAPNFEAFKAAGAIFENTNIQDPDIIGAHFKIQNIPLPSKNDFQKFANSQNIGLFVFAFDQKAHIVDAISFKNIQTVDIKYEDKETYSPFYTNIEDIKGAIYDIGSSKISNFNNFYKKFLDKEETNDSTSPFAIFKKFTW